MPIELTRNAPSLEHTRVIADDLAAILRRGDVVRLEGEMGAGKTTFVRLLAQNYGIAEEAVSSPTFVIMNIYGDEDSDHPTLAHLDCYRLGDESELDVLIEWPERIDDAIPVDALRVSIDHVDETTRRFRFSIPEHWAERAGFDAIRPRPDTTCPVTGRAVSGDSLTWPFASEQARMADLNAWFNEEHVISRPIEQADLEQGE